jgi:hypothetical protein
MSVGKHEGHIPVPSLEAQRLIVLCCEGARVCPLPLEWNGFWELLLKVADAKRLARPPAPFILSVWSGSQTTPTEKAVRLRDQIIWADVHGALAAARDYLTGIPEGRWLHHGEWPA